jgi:hypothetical protein
MADPNPTRAPMAGGFLLMLGILLGTVVGLVGGQPSAGFVLGLALGAILAVTLWFFDRKRS